MNRKKYFELYKDPRWQKLRLEVLERDDWTCQYCKNKEETLHVHHNYYEKGYKPWEYTLAALITLCEACHEEETLERPNEESALLDIIRRMGYSYSDVSKLSIFIYRPKNKVGGSND